MIQAKDYPQNLFRVLQSHMGPEVSKCQKKYCDIIWDKDEIGKWFYRFGEAKTCGAPIFLSPTTNKLLSCGGCEIRKGALVLEVKKVLWVMAGDPNKSVVNANRRIALFSEMSGCDFVSVMSEAKKEFEIEYRKFREERDRKRKERERLLEEKQKEKEYARLKA